MSTLYKVGGKYIVAFFDDRVTPRKRWRFNTRLADKAAAREIQRKIDDLIDFSVAKKLPSGNMADWIESCPDYLRAKLIEARLIDDRHCRMDDLVAMFRQALADKGSTANHVDKTVKRLQTVLDGCKIATTADMTTTAIERYLADQRTSKAKGGKLRGFSRATSNHYAAAIKQFSAWLLRERIVNTDPLSDLKSLNAKVDRQERMVLGADDLRRLVQTTRTEPERFSMSGPDRALLYQLAVETGLRASELRSLTRASFDLAAADPIVTIEAADAKNRRRDTLPLRSGVVAILLVHMEHKTPNTPVFVLPPKPEMARMLRADAKAAGVRTADDSGRRLDFHSLRHTFITNLAAAGVHPKTAQVLARHSTVTLTLDRYSHSFREAETAAVGNLPDVSVGPAESIRATGTHDMGAQGEQNRERASRFPRPRRAPSGTGGRWGSNVENTKKAEENADLAMCGVGQRQDAPNGEKYPQGDLNPCYQDENLVS